MGVHMHTHECVHMCSHTNSRKACLNSKYNLSEKIPWIAGGQIISVCWKASPQPNCAVPACKGIPWCTTEWADVVNAWKKNQQIPHYMEPSSICCTYTAHAV